MKLKTACLFVSYLFASAAHAVLILEPSIGTQGSTGGSAFTYQYGTNVYKYYQQSVPVGLALLVKLPVIGLMAGVQGEYYAGGYLTPQTANQFGFDQFTKTIGRGVIGFESIIGLRLLVGYDFVNNMSNTPASNNTNDFTALNGNGYAAMIGWRIGHLALNAVYDVPTGPTSITPKNSGSTATFTNSTYNSFSNTGTWNINIGFPMEFL